MRIGKGTGRTARWLLAVVMAFGVSAAMAQIANTKHNLGSSNPRAENKTSGTDEICVFCHTPHAADVSTVGLPLWNKKLPTTNGYTTYSSSTMNALNAIDGVGGGSIGSVSLACLSCHDGTQAMDNILNAPGSGGYDVTGGGQDGRVWTWTGSGVNTGTGRMSSGVAMLGPDLNNDHPIGIQYCGGGYTTSAPGTQGPLTAGDCSDTDFKAPVSAVIGSQQVFWVETGGNVTRSKTDLTLFNREFTAGSFGPSVECASCHDPHTNANPTFLRISNTGSGVCLACHSK